LANLGVVVWAIVSWAVLYAWYRLALCKSHVLPGTSHRDFNASWCVSYPVGALEAMIAALANGMSTTSYGDSCRPLVSVSVRRLDTTLPMEELARRFKAHGFIQLRPVTHKRLLIGCGNGPLFRHACFGDRNVVDDEYTARHKHAGWTTMDVCADKNPTVIGGFGFHSLPEEWTEMFEEIAFEGCFPTSQAENVHTLREVQRLLQPGGRVSVDGVPIRFRLARILGALGFGLFYYGGQASPLYPKQVDYNEPSKQQ
jgi:hypothetical protein